MLRTEGVSGIQLIGPHVDDPRITVIVPQKLSVSTEPTIRREIHGIAGTTIVG